MINILLSISVSLSVLTAFITSYIQIKVGRVSTSKDELKDNIIQQRDEGVVHDLSSSAKKRKLDDEYVETRLRLI